MLQALVVGQFEKVSRKDAKMKVKDAMKVLKLCGFAIFTSLREIKLTHYPRIGRVFI